MRRVVPDIIQFHCTLAELKFRLQSQALCLLNGEARPRTTLPKERLCLVIYHKRGAGAKGNWSRLYTMYPNYAFIVLVFMQRLPVIQNLQSHQWKYK